MYNRLKKIRKNFGLTQQEFADRLGLKRAAYANYEIGRNTLNYSYIKLICGEFNINEEWLISGEGDMFKETNISLLYKLKNKYGLSNLEFTLLKEYLKLDKKQREVFENYFDNVIKAQSNVDVNNTENEIEKYIKELPDTPNEFEKANIVVSENSE